MEAVDLRSVSCTMICTTANMARGVPNSNSSSSHLQIPVLCKKVLRRSPAVSRMKKDYTCQSCHNQLPFSQGEKGTGSAFCIDDQAGNSKEEKKMKDRQKLPAKRPPSASWFL